METKLTIKPVHLAIAVAAIIAVVIALPMINAAYDMAYPPVGSVRRTMIDRCAEQQSSFNRWSADEVKVCLAYERLIRR